MDVRKGFYTVDRFYAHSETLPLAVEHDTREDAQVWAHLVSEDIGTRGWVDVVADGRLVAVWRNGQVTLMERSMRA